MLDYDEIKAEIARLESGNTTYASVNKLSALYTVLDHSASEPEVRVSRYSYADSPQTEFEQAFRAIPLEDALAVLNEHFEAVRAIYPKEYSEVLRRLKAKGEV